MVFHTLRLGQADVELSSPAVVCTMMVVFGAHIAFPGKFILGLMLAAEIAIGSIHCGGAKKKRN